MACLFVYNTYFRIGGVGVSRLILVAILFYCSLISILFVLYFYVVVPFVFLDRLLFSDLSWNLNQKETGQILDCLSIVWIKTCNLTWEGFKDLKRLYM